MKNDNSNINLIQSLSTTLNGILGLTQSKENSMVNTDDKIKMCFKVLILDEVSMRIFSPILKQSTLNANNVVLTIKIDDDKPKIHDIMAIYIVSPSKRNLDFILRDQKNNAFMNYSLNFIDNVDEIAFQEFLYAIVQGDTSKRHFNINVYPVNINRYHPNVFDLNIDNPYRLLNSSDTIEEQSSKYIDDLANGLFSLLYMSRSSPRVAFRKGWFADDIVKKVQYKFNSLFSRFPSLKTEFDESNRNNSSLMLLLNRDDDIPIMFHHASSLGAMINDICGITLNSDGDKGNKDAFIIDPINDNFWNKSITSPFYAVGDEALLEYKKYIAEMTQLSSTNKENASNVEALAKESEKLALSIENLNDKKAQGDILNKQTNAYKIINENTNKRNLGQLYEIEDMILRKRNSNSEITKKLEEIAINKDNAEDVLRLYLMYMMVSKYVNGEEVIKKLGGYVNKDKIKKIVEILENKKNEKNEGLGNEDGAQSNLAKKYLKKGLMYFVNRVSSLIITEQPSIVADVVNSVANGKMKDFTEIVINEKFISENKNNCNNIFVFMVGGGSLAEYEYIYELLSKNRVNVIYGCDKLYRPKEFLNEIELINKN